MKTQIIFLLILCLLLSSFFAVSASAAEPDELPFSPESSAEDIALEDDSESSLEPEPSPEPSEAPSVSDISFDEFTVTDTLLVVITVLLFVSTLFQIVKGG